jgi:hypothetical protein
MNDLGPPPGRAYRLAPAGHRNGVSCDANGPSLGPVRLLRRTMFGFEPRPANELDFVLSRAFAAPVRMAKRTPELAAVAVALEEGDLARATITTLHMRLPALDNARASRAHTAEKLIKGGFNPDEPRDGRGRWTSEGGGADVVPVQYVPARNGNRAESGGQSDGPGTPGAASRTGVPVVLPDGSKVPDGYDPTGYMMSPVADLGPVAAAGRAVGTTYQALLNDPQLAGGASLYLFGNLGINLMHGGTFDYQREGNLVTGFVQLGQFRAVSDFNVGLFCQQAGLSLDETRWISGLYARLFSSNAKPDQPYSLDTRTAAFTTRGYNVGASGLFGPPARRASVLP